MWHHPWLTDIIAYLVSVTNPGRTLTKSNLDLAALILNEDNFLEVCPDAKMDVPRSVSDNKPTVSWITWKSYTINLVVTDLLRICTLHSRQFLKPLSIPPPRPGETYYRWRILPF